MVVDDFKTMAMVDVTRNLEHEKKSDQGTQKGTYKCKRTER